ncbi:5'-methylthioadenosine/adenosylhomocysteine nucleosidase [Enterococcus timonensis]|uniref:5'-methylthioadenosine/adenosylhomocysteine nucleosidase n=1 Tax=Enterococcus timonensis TaxID=1852364 RepID=UPI0008DA8FD4|nr:5'-methylthioadenosine/adenosylhomocysteine nucleosidase [Enterococcus timonensis]
MKIGIIGAMAEEILLLQETLQDVATIDVLGRNYFTGQYLQHEIIFVESGIGKVMSAVTTTILVEKFGAELIINTGSAGGIGAGLQVGDVVIAEKLAYFDADVTGFGYAYGQMPGQPLYYETAQNILQKAQIAAKAVGQNVRSGLIVTGDSFVDHPEKITVIQKHFPEALACEMEGAAIAQAASSLHVPHLVIRAISDTADHEATVSFDEFIITAGKKSATMVLTLLGEL